MAGEAKSIMSGSQKLRIVYIITGLETGGAEMMLLRLIESTQGELIPTVISLTNEGELGTHLKSQGVPVIALGLRPNFGIFLSLPRLVREIRASKANIIQTWMYHANLFGGIAAYLASDTPVVWGIHHSNLAFSKNKLHTLLTAYLSAIVSRVVPNAIIYCSNRSAYVHHHIGYSREKAFIIPNGFDLSMFSPNPSFRYEIRGELGIDDECPLIGLVARFDPQKNHQGFIEAAGIVGKSHPEARFLMCGSSVDWSNKKLVEWICRTGFRSRFFLIGKRNDVSRLMSSLDILVSSSHGEAFPNVIGEAMACGVPCAATDVGDSAWMIGDTGKVVAPQNSGALAQAMSELLLMPREQRVKLGMLARKRIQENFTMSRVARKYIETYWKIANRLELK